MKLLAVLLAAAGLTGCVAYPYGAPGYYGQGYYQGAPYVVQPQSSLYIESGPRYRTERGYYGRRDRDRDGVPDRFDRRPYDPSRY
jgi:hypothetical protein